MIYYDTSLGMDGTCRRVKLITRLKLKPGQRGTKKLLAKYGDALVCVRYRYDDTTRTRIKTIELVVEKTSLRKTTRVVRGDALVPVRIGFAEKDLIASARAAKGRWDPEAKLWFIKYENILGTALEKNIVLDAFGGQ